MRKFLAWAFILTTAVGLTFTVTKLIGTMEVISVSASGEEIVELGDNVIYTEVGESFSVEINQSNKNPNTEVAISSADEKIVKANSDGTFTAISGGHTVIKVATTNVYFRNLTIEVFVGDGAEASPYYIFNEVQLASIGGGTDSYPNYKLTDSYKLIGDINLQKLNQGLWKPLGAFSGRLDGNGHTISNLVIDKNQYINQFGMIHAESFTNNGLFSKVETDGKIFNLNLSGVTVKNINSVAIASTIGTVAGINNGRIEGVSVQSASLLASADYVGGVVGINQTPKDFTSFPARLDRVWASVEIGKPSSLAVGGTIGGLAGANIGGTIIYSYSLGSVNLATDATFGGITGKNQVLCSGGFIGALIKDTYSAVKVYTRQATADSLTVGGVIGYNVDSLIAGENQSTANIIMGSFYNTQKLNIVEVSVPNKTYKGIGKDERSGEVITRTEQKYFVHGYATNQLKVKDNYQSHQRYETIINTLDEVIQENNLVIQWNFLKIWDIDAYKNSGYPVLRNTQFQNNTLEDYERYDDFHQNITLYLDAYLVHVNIMVDGKEPTSGVEVSVYNENGNLTAVHEGKFALTVLSDAVIVNHGQSIVIYRDGIIVNRLTARSTSPQYNLLGWANQGGSTKWTEELHCISDIYLTVQLQEVEIKTTAIFNYNGATGPFNLPPQQPYVYGQTYGQLPQPMKLDYRFDGWYLEANFKTKIDELTVVTASSSTHNLYAKWIVGSQASYSIVYYSNGGTGTYTDSVKIGNGYYLLSNTQAGIARTSHTFLGWATSASGTVKYTPLQQIIPTSNLSLYAVWQANQTDQSYVISAARHSQSADVGMVLSVRVNGKQATFTAISSTGYKFMGWYSNGTSIAQRYLVSQQTIYSTTVKANTTLYGYWLKVNINVCDECGQTYTGDYCPNQTYCSSHGFYYHDCCPGVDSCSACDNLYQCGYTCPYGDINYCSEHGDYHGDSCPEYHETTCDECGATHNVGVRCPNLKYCNAHRIYYHDECPEFKVCLGCWTQLACGDRCPDCLWVWPWTKK